MSRITPTFEQARAFRERARAEADRMFQDPEYIEGYRSGYTDGTLLLRLHVSITSPRKQYARGYRDGQLDHQLGRRRRFELI